VVDSPHQGGCSEHDKAYIRGWREWRRRERWVAQPFDRIRPATLQNQRLKSNRDRERQQTDPEGAPAFEAIVVGRRGALSTLLANAGCQVDTDRDAARDDGPREAGGLRVNWSSGMAPSNYSPLKLDLESKRNA
jgi:hypothetical protein